MVFRLAWLFLIFPIGLLDHFVSGADITHPRVPGFERFYAVPAATPTDDEEELIHFDPLTGGRMLLGELNCVACHTASDEAKSALTPKQAPVLDNVGNRVRVEWLRAYLAKPHEVRPGTTMPDLIATLPDVDREGSVEALTHFLASTGVVPNAAPHREAAKKGEALFQKVGCLACHNPNSENAPLLQTSVPLTGLAKKYTWPSLMEFLKDPLKSRPSGRMPAMGLSDEDYRSLATYFVPEGSTTPNTRFSVYHGDWNSLPKFGVLKPNAEGESAGFDLAVAGLQSAYAIRFTGHLRIQHQGEYQFWLGSDDGSQLQIDDELIVDCDGIHPHQTKVGQKSLEAGFHKVVVDYFQGGGEASLEVLVAGPKMAQQPLSGFLFLEPKLPPAHGSAVSDPRRVNSPPDQQSFSVDLALVSQGHRLFGTLGCAACHSMTMHGQAVVNQLKAKPLMEVTVNTGCLAEQVTGKAPRYGLNAAQRTSLSAAAKAQSKEEPQETIHRILATLNCYACHKRDKIGGVEAARDAVFESLQKEMGDEGRLPPVLTGVGDKLRPDWLKHVLHHGGDDRKNYMVTKMPRFGPQNVDSLAALLSTVDLQPETMPHAGFNDPEFRIKGFGRHLVGGSALSCIKCHDFGTHSSTGIRAISLTTLHRRVRPDWFYRYVLDPQVYRRGTRMPSAWPNGRSSIRDVLNADVNQQVQAIWLYLSDEDKAAVPAGLVRESIELKPLTEPLIYRNFIEGAGARAIGVGYPGGVNLAFDANDMRLAMIWHGAFIDASRHWTGRGQGFEPPLGDEVLHLPQHGPFVVHDNPDRPVPTALARDLGYKFLGYRLDAEQRPTFRYCFQDLTIEDFCVPIAGIGKFPALNRTLKFTVSDARNPNPTGEKARPTGSDIANPLWFRAAVADKLEDLGDGHFRIDGNWSMKVRTTGSRLPILRSSGGKLELLVPIQLQDGSAEILLQYDW